MGILDLLFNDNGTPPKKEYPAYYFEYDGRDCREKLLQVLAQAPAGASPGSRGRRIQNNKPDTLSSGECRCH